MENVVYIVVLEERCDYQSNVVVSAFDTIEKAQNKYNELKVEELEKANGWGDFTKQEIVGNENINKAFTTIESENGDLEITIMFKEQVVE